MRTAFIAAALAGALATPAGAAIQSLSVELPVATWHEPLIARYSGAADCFVATGEVSLAEDVVTVELDESCLIDPPSFQPFAGQADLGDLEPGSYTVRFTSGGETEFSGEMRVFAEADVVIDVPESPVAGSPLQFTVTGLSSGCIGPEPPQVSGNLIVAHFPTDCPILPPGFGLLTYEYATPPLAAGTYEIHVFVDGIAGLKKARVTVFPADACVPASDALCLRERRFRVEVAWRDFEGHTGVGQAVPLPGRDDSGLFWFFDPGNVELTLKVLDGCGLNARYWVFLASGSTVEYTVTVTDTATDTTWTEHHPSGVLPALVADTSAFATCP